MEIIIVLIGAVVGALLSGFIGFYFYKIEKADREKEKDKAEKDLVEYYYKIMSESIKDIKKQSSYYKEFILNINDNKYGKNGIKINLGYALDKLERYDTVEMFYAIRKNNSKINYNNYFSLIKNLLYLKTIIKDSMKTHIEYSQNLSEIQGRYKEKIEDISDNIALFIRQLKREEGEDVKGQDSFTFLNEMLGKFRDLADNNAKLEDYNKEFLYPIIDGIVNNTNRGNYFYADFLTINAKKARVLLDDMKNINNEFKNNFNKFVEKFEPKIKEMEELIKNLELNANR